MRRSLHSSILLLASLLLTPLYAEEAVLTFVFGPSSQEAARQSAHAAAATARRWLQNDGNLVFIRQAGSPDAQQIDAHTDAKKLEQAFNDAAFAARQADPSSFVITLDSAAQAAALHPGARIVVAALNSPPFSSDGERSLEHLSEICQTNNVRIVVLDAAESPKAIPSAVLQGLVTKTGGVWVKQAKSLDAELAMVLPSDETPAPAAPAPTASAQAAESKPAQPGAIPKFEIPIRVRFLRTSGTGSVGSSMMDHEADFGMTATLGGAGYVTMGAGSAEVAYEANDPHSPLQGFIAVESPLNGLKFDIDDNTNTYQAKARITANVRNAKGAVIWTGRREINVHGPISKLDDRRQGNFYFMRSLSLPGQGPFTLEARIEDLIAGNSGSVQAPVKVGRNAPGLVATDALVVRPFKGSADKFEADQVLSYEGEALSPVLDPVFRAEKPIDLQIYLRLYPDIHGAPLDMSMEVLNEGHVVARIPLPFKSGMASSAREGASSKIAGRVENMAGGQAKEFPYLVNLKGAQFPPGDYLGIISIRQSKNVIKRAVPFKVVGKGPEAPMVLAKAAKGALEPAADGDNADFVLPEIAPATIDSTGLKMREDEQRQLWDTAAKNAMGYLDHLPNFRCLQETHRFSAPAKTPDQLKEADSFKDELLYEDGKERYRRVEINGLKVENATEEKKGIQARNEFGSLLRGLFDPEVGASYKWAGRAMAMGVLCQVFEIQVGKQKSNFVLHYGNQREPAAYSGRIFIDEETGMVRRLTIDGTGLPKEFGLQSPALSLDYGVVKIGKDDFLLPLRSTLQLRHAKTFVRNETTFRSYRKFDAESQVKFNN